MTTSNKIYFLKNYDESSPGDGLSFIYHSLKSNNEAVNSSEHLSGNKIVICGIPHLYTNKLSKNNINICVTTYESSILPPFWVMALNQYYSHCIVPHDAIKDIFIRSGVKIQIHVSPFGFKRLHHLREKGIEDRYFKVGFLGVPVKRKNLKQLYAACKKLQKLGISNLQLTIHSSHIYEWVKDKKFEKIKNDPIVKWSTGTLTDVQLANWYSELSCYIFPSSGEGWSLTPRESMALSIPTIISDIAVHRELIESGYCSAIKAETYQRAYFEGRYYGKWASITASSIADSIIDAYLNYDAHLKKAEEGASWIAGKWTISDMQTSVNRIIQDI